MISDFELTWKNFFFMFKHTIIMTQLINDNDDDDCFISPKHEQRQSILMTMYAMQHYIAAGIDKKHPNNLKHVVWALGEFDLDLNDYIYYVAGYQQQGCRPYRIWLWPYTIWPIYGYLHTVICTVRLHFSNPDSIVCGMRWP